MLAEATHSRQLFAASLYFRSLAINPWTATLILIMLQDEPAELRPPEETAVYFQALKDNAQLLDLHSANDHWGRFEWEAGWCQRYYRKCHGMPLISDLHLLPPDEVIESQIQFNRLFDNWLQDQRFAKLYAFHRYTALAEENDKIYKSLTSMMQAKHHLSRHAIGDIRIQLGTIRDIVGWEAYYSGRWPSHVPLAGFEQR